MIAEDFDLLEGLVARHGAAEVRRVGDRIADYHARLAEIAAERGLPLGADLATGRIPCRNAVVEVRGLAPPVKAINGDRVPAHACAAGPEDPSCCAACGAPIAVRREPLCVGCAEPVDKRELERALPGEDCSLCGARATWSASAALFDALEAELADEERLSRRGLEAGSVYPADSTLDAAARHAVRKIRRRS